jgi:branched-subunit amino acid aminotransferase/4-amino-4-deoxychorismate lyase
VLELAAELDVPVVEEPFAAADLWRASEVVVTATTADVMPVVSVDGRPIGDGRVGPVAGPLSAAFRARLERETVGAPAD